VSSGIVVPHKKGQTSSRILLRRRDCIDARVSFFVVTNLNSNPKSPITYVNMSAEVDNTMTYSNLSIVPLALSSNVYSYTLSLNKLASSSQFRTPLFG
jgi:hypothetical protein